LVAEIKQGGESMRCGHDDVATVTAVAAVRTSTWDKHFSPETADTVSAASGSDGDVNFIDEHTVVPFCEQLSG